MNYFKEQWLKYKISELHPKDLMHYGDLYNVPITFEEASYILKVVQNNNWSLEDKESLHHLLAKVEKGVSPHTFQALKQLFHQYVG